VKLFRDVAEPSMMLVRLWLGSPKDPRGSVGLFLFLGSSGAAVTFMLAGLDLVFAIFLAETACFGAIGDVCLELTGSAEWQSIGVKF
jgi:hypothetical protein